MIALGTSPGVVGPGCRLRQRNGRIGLRVRIGIGAAVDDVLDDAFTYHLSPIAYRLSPGGGVTSQADCWLLHVGGIAISPWIMFARAWGAGADMRGK